jgi:hypothetical protein
MVSGKQEANFEQVELAGRLDHAVNAFHGLTAGNAKSELIAVWTDALRLHDHRSAAFAAHFLGLLDLPLREKVVWHLRSIEQADAAGSDESKGWYASAYQNLGHCYHLLGEDGLSVDCYRKAEVHSRVLEDNEYGRGVREAIRRGLKCAAKR